MLDFIAKYILGKLIGNVFKLKIKLNIVDRLICNENWVCLRFNIKICPIFVQIFFDGKVAVH